MSGATDQTGQPFAVLIAGPTASGKSALALRLAGLLDGEIVNADSMQVYRELRILTARPSEAEEATRPHRLYGHVSGAEAYSTGQWVADAVAAIDAVAEAGRVPIVVGGTGLYFKALTEGFVDVPPIPDDVRVVTRAEVDRIGPPAAHRLLRDLDPAWAAQVHENDPQRIARGLEVVRATGRPLTDWHRDPAVPPLALPALKIVLEPDRAWLYERIDRRFAAMVEAGALDEVEALLALDLPAHLPAMKALGVPDLAAHVSGDLELEAAMAQAATRSRQYAKRQSTWFRQQMIAWNRLHEQDLESQIGKIFSFIDDFGLTVPR